MSDQEIWARTFLIGKGFKIKGGCIHEPSKDYVVKNEEIKVIEYLIENHNYLHIGNIKNK